ncbi:MAG: AMP-binding protein [Acidimicrobiia bacterium]
MRAEWVQRPTAAHLADRYRSEGWWTDDTLGRLVDDAVEARPELRLRVWSATRPFDGTVADVRDDTRRLAGALRARGIGPDDVVAFQLPNWAEAAVTFYAVSIVGAVLVPVVHFYGPRELGYILRETGARALVTADRFGHLDYLAGLEALRPGLPALELVAVVGASPGPGDAVPFTTLVRDGTPDGRVTAVDPDAPAVVGYTSGTTANPKGVVHSHRSLAAELRQVQTMGAMPSRPTLVGAPVGHAIGMQGGLLLPLLRGTDLHLIDVWNPPAVLAAMTEAGLTSGSGSTYFLQSLLDDPGCTPEHLRLVERVGLGGAPVPAAVADRAESLGVTVVRSYGSTEHPSTTGSRYDDPLAKRGYTDGRPLGGVDLRLVDADGRDVALGEPGEILTRGPDLFVGYTDAALTALAVDGDGWYSTGDVGVLDADGFLTITDRTKDIIIRGGENISAAEVEELLARLPGVAEVAVVAAPDPRLGEHACAFLRMQPGSEAGAASTLDGIRRHLEAGGLARQKWPEELRVVADFPRTPSGKVKKFVLRAQLRGEPT